MIDVIQNQIENLKHYDYDTLDELQKSKLPSVYELETERVQSLTIHDINYNQYQENYVLYLVHSLPYINRTSHVFSTTINELVDKEEMCPILIFIDGKFVKWSNINIISDCKYTYIYIKGINNKIKHNITCISFPFKIEYKEGVSDKNNNSLFKFDYNGKCVSKVSSKCTTIDIPKIHNNIVYDTKLMELNKIYSYPDSKYQLCNNNFIIFRNGLLNLDYIMDFRGLNVFQINKGNIELNSRYYIFYYKNNNESLNHMYKLPNKEYIKNQVFKSSNNDFKEFNKDFKFSYNRNLTYEENLNNALEYIMKYDSSLIDSLYEKLSTIKSIEYTGSYIKNLSKNGYTTMKRMIDNSICEIIIFCNGKLYEGYSETKYNNIEFTFPVSTIKNSDRIEILYFKNVNNNVNKLFMRSDSDDIYTIPSTVNVDDLSIFVNEPYERNFKNDITNIMYEINMECKDRNGDKVTIIPSNSYYYDRYVYLASKRQFRYGYKIIQDQTIYATMLNHDEFKYCKNKNQFLVFLNGLKLNSDQYIVTIPNINNPYTDVSVFFNEYLKKGDKVELFYVPEELEEVISKKTFTSAYMILDKSKLDYSFNNNTYLVFSNGRKIRPSDIITLNSNKIGIKNLTSNNNLSFIKYIKPIDILNKLYHSISNEYDELINNLSHDLSVKLFGNISINNKESSISSTTFNMKHTVYEIINKYFNRCNINQNDDFIYEIDDYFEKTENGYIIPYLDANMIDKLNL